jgi:hypothetical protein
MSNIRNIRGLVMAGIVALAAMASSDAYAQASDQATASANAVIAKPITITTTANLDFGTIVPNSAGDLTVVVDTADTTPPTLGGVVDGAWIGGTISSAAFDVTGRPNASYGITLPASATITGGATGATMTVDTFNDSFGGTNAVPASSTLVVGATPGLGEDSFTVGATLTVPAAQAADTYTGNFNVTVAYN